MGMITHKAGGGEARCEVEIQPRIRMQVEVVNHIIRILRSQDAGNRGAQAEALIYRF